MKKKVYLLLFFLVICIYSISQTRGIDSVSQLLRNEKTDTGKVILLNNLSRQYSHFRPDTAMQLAQQALSLAKKISFIKGEISSLIVIGNSFARAGNYPKALMFFLEALNKAESINDQQQIARALKGIYVNYSERGDERQAVNYALQTVAINKHLQDDNALATDMENLGDGYMILNIMDSALWYNTEGYNIALRQNDTTLIGYGLLNFGNIYAKTGQDTKALNFYRSALPFSKQIRDDEALCDIYLGIAKVFQKVNNRDSCMYYAKLSFNTAKEAGFTMQVMNACDFLTNYYISIHNTDSAFVYQSASIEAKDSLFNQEKAKEVQSLILNEVTRQQQLEDAKAHFQNQLKFGVLGGGIFCLLITAFHLYRNNRHKQRANVSLARQKQKAEDALQQLRSTQAQLIQSEKMASLGQLTAGIAHEIQNPLNFVNNFSVINNELIDELKRESSIAGCENGSSLSQELLNDIYQNNEKIVSHGKRADAIVKSMLEHSQQGAGQKQLTDINSLVDEYLKLAYHGIKAKYKDLNVIINTEFDYSIHKVNVVTHDIGIVLLNLYNNAFYAVNEKRKQQQEGYDLIVTVSTKKVNGKIEVIVEDNGNGIPQNIVDKIFQPFFTTKPTGQGTGLGLSLAYDIINANGGNIMVESREGEGSRFYIQLSAQ